MPTNPRLAGFAGRGSFPRARRTALRWSHHRRSCLATFILLNVPLALVGGFVALWVFSIPLSVSAAIGFIALSGQAVLNGVVMLSVFQQFEAAGSSVVEAVRAGSIARLRTVLMTALLAALGLLPMALSHDIGAETQRPLAIVVIGGLFTATLLTLVVLPALYVAWFTPRLSKAQPTNPSARVQPRHAQEASH